MQLRYQSRDPIGTKMPGYSESNRQGRVLSPTIHYSIIPILQVNLFGHLMTNGPRITFSHRFKECPELTFVQARPNFSDYTPQERQLIQTAEKVYYPTHLYVDLFITMGKKIFPSRETYVYSGDKIKQTALFQFLDIGHPRTRIYFGRQTEKIRTDFPFPFIAKIPRGSSMGRGVFLIHNEEELEKYLQKTSVAYIQEYLDLDRDLRVILINHQIILSYWKIAPMGEFRNNLAQGASIEFSQIPEEALAFAQWVTRRCNFDDVGLDLCHTPGKGWMILEANMNYGLQALTEKGFAIRQVLRDLVIQGEI
ncbi:MAG: RimK family alpha-L-glutamate ligase [Desulfobacca sp.]|nr:RimK family alpha-L-glutamate ligase [Desulfobacca sp.]